MSAEFNPSSVHDQLLAAARKGSGELYRIRRSLSKDQAAAVSALLSPIDRAAIRLAMAFGDDGSPGNRWRPFEGGESAVIWDEDLPLP